MASEAHVHICLLFGGDSKKDIFGYSSGVRKA